MALQLSPGKCPEHVFLVEPTASGFLAMGISVTPPIVRTGKTAEEAKQRLAAELVGKKPSVVSGDPAYLYALFPEIVEAGKLPVQ